MCWIFARYIFKHKSIVVERITMMFSQTNESFITLIQTKQLVYLPKVWVQQIVNIIMSSLRSTRENMCFLCACIINIVYFAKDVFVRSFSFLFKSCYLLYFPFACLHHERMNLYTETLKKKIENNYKMQHCDQNHGQDIVIETWNLIIRTYSVQSLVYVQSVRLNIYRILSTDSLADCISSAEYKLVTFWMITLKLIHNNTYVIIRAIWKSFFVYNASEVSTIDVQINASSSCKSLWLEKRKRPIGIPFFDP